MIYICFFKKSRKKTNVNGKVKAWVQKNGKLYIMNAKIQHSGKCQIKVQKCEKTVNKSWESGLKWFN